MYALTNSYIMTALNEYHSFSKAVVGFTYTVNDIYSILSPVIITNKITVVIFSCGYSV